MNTYRTTATDVEYQDTRMMYLGIPLMTIFVVHVGIEDGFLELLANSLYYENLIVSLAIAYLTFFSIRACILGFDQWSPWKEERNQVRWCLQLIVCTLITSFWLFVNDFYDYIMLGEQELLDQVLLTVDLPVSVLLIMGLNYYYYIQFGEARRQSAITQLDLDKREPSTGILLKTPGGYCKTQQEEIQVAFLENDLTCLIDQDGKKRYSDLSLTALEKELGGTTPFYFRLNRKLLIHRAAVKGYQRTKGHRLQLELTFHTSVKPIVSKNKAARFKSWWHQTLSI